MFKVYLVVAIAIIYGSFISLATWKITTGNQAKKENKIIIEKVENHNADTISLAKHSETIAKIERDYEKALLNIPRVKPSINDCPVDEFKRVYNQAVRAANSMHIEN